MAESRPLIIVVGLDLDEAERDRLSTRFEVLEASTSDNAIEMLIQGTLARDVPTNENIDGEGARRLQTRIDEIDDAGGDLLDLGDELGDGQRPTDIVDEQRVIGRRLVAGGE